MKSLLKLDRPVALVGMMGAGKSEAGCALARRLNLPFLDSDREVERQAGASVAALFEREGEAAFRQRERDTVAILLRKGPCILAAGGGAMADELTRPLLLDNALTVWLQAEPEVLLARLGDLRARPLLQARDPLQALRQLLAERTPHYRRAAIHVCSEEGGARETAVRIAQALADHISPA